MFIEERHQAILNLLSEQGSVSNTQIQEQFGISYDSAKRDLRILEEKGLLKRTHGGAIPNKSIGSDDGLHDLSAKERVQNIWENYLQVAKKAISTIQPKDVVYITNGGIGFIMAQNMPRDIVCTIVTTSISIAEELRKYDNITVIVTGGEMSKNGSFYDSFTLEIINRLRFDKCFITSACISADFGISIQKTRNVGLINAILNNSKTKYGLYPTEKIGFESIVSICPASKLDFLITDWEASEEDLSLLDEQGIEIIIVDKPE
jgi:DeoR/GlpR family transcriptional regulator of sugar metabolism